MDILLDAVHWINQSTAGATERITNTSDALWKYFLLYALVAVGLFITVATRGIQFRSIGEMFRTLKNPAGTEYNGKKSISAFRAFTVSAASRVGTGNIAGVALAISIGGPGAVFWMWVIASVGAASAFAESLLGQLYKRKGEDSYIGGPAYYMQRGLNARWLGLIFVAFIVVTYAFVFVAVQTNSIVDAVAGSFNVDVTETHGMGFRLAIGAIIAVISAFIIFGGIRTISSVTEVLVPVMAVLYLFLGVLIVAMNLGEIPGMIGDILAGAFGVKEFTTGGLIAVITQGMRRGLLSNEAGMGTAPNAGATASVSHPAKQGFVQALGVYFDTMLVCSITAFIVLLSKFMEEVLIDDNMVFDIDNLKGFLNDTSSFGFIAKENNKIIGFAYCYTLLRPDGKTMFYLHSIGMLPNYQDKGYGSKLLSFIKEYSKEIGCSEMFLITDKGNPRACHVYEKLGGKNDYKDEIVYVYDYEKGDK